MIQQSGRRTVDISEGVDVLLNGRKYLIPRKAESTSLGPVEACLRRQCSDFGERRRPVSFVELEMGILGCLKDLEFVPSASGTAKLRHRLALQAFTNIKANMS